MDKYIYIYIYVLCIYPLRDYRGPSLAFSARRSLSRSSSSAFTEFPEGALFLPQLAELAELAGSFGSLGLP